MKTLELENLGVAELKSTESSEINGGFWPLVAIVAIAISAVNNFGDIREGLADGFNGTPRH